MNDSRVLLWDHIRRQYGDRTTLSVDDLEETMTAEKHKMDRSEMVWHLKDLAESGMGTFRNGRRGRPSRIMWKRKPSLSTLPTVENAQAMDDTPKMLDYPLVIRPGVEARITLPHDLTSAEAKRVSQFVESLPLD